MAKIIPITEYFQHFLEPMKESFWGVDCKPDKTAGVDPCEARHIQSRLRPERMLQRSLFNYNGAHEEIPLMAISFNMENNRGDIMKSRLSVPTILAVIMLFAACDAAKKTAAEAAIQGAQTAYSAVADQANQYVPDQAKDVQTSIQAAKDAFDKGDYGAALEAAKSLPEKIKALAAAAMAKKDELTAKWNDMSSSMPGLVSSVQTKMDAMSKSHKLPAGAADNMASAKQAWSDASAAFQSGKLQDAMSKASAAKDKLNQLQTMLGMKPAA